MAVRDVSVHRLDRVQDVRFTPAITAAVHAELQALTAWLGLTTLITA